MEPEDGMIDLNLGVEGGERTIMVAAKQMVNITLKERGLD